MTGSCCRVCVLQRISTSLETRESAGQDGKAWQAPNNDCSSNLQLCPRANDGEKGRKQHISSRASALGHVLATTGCWQQQFLAASHLCHKGTAHRAVTAAARCQH